MLLEQSVSQVAALCCEALIMERANPRNPFFFLFVFSVPWSIGHVVGSILFVLLWLLS
jgi:hypothetical protein